MAASASKDELVLPFRQSLEALDAIESGGGMVLGWEGWLRRNDGSLGHSSRHQGTVNLTGMPRHSAFAFCRMTIAAANDEHALAPEVSGSELLICITYGA